MHNRFKKIGAAALAGVLALSLMPAAFAADTSMTRGELAATLWQDAGKPASTSADPFVDVKSGDKNYTAILWAAENGIVSGSGKSYFNPQGSVSREQLAVMLYRYAKANGDGMILSFDISGYADFSTVSPWSVDAVKWAVAKEYLTATDNKLNPQGAATAAEVDALLARYDEMAPHSHSMNLTGVVNARDLGGYITADGKTVKDGVLLRTGKMSGATEADVKALSDTYHVTQIVDFRSSSEFTQDPDPTLPGCVNTNLPVISEQNLAGAMTATDTQNMSDMVKLIYEGFAMSEQSIGAYQKYFKLLLEHKDGAILWHCTAGQDRAGVASYLLLVALGVDEQTARQDYLTSIDFGGSVQPDWLDTFLAKVATEYGGVKGYLTKAIKLTDADFKTLQDKYLV